MSLQKVIPLFAIIAIPFLFGCKKEPVQMSTLAGNWIQETSNSFKIELEILSDGTIYTTYADTSGIHVDTGSVEILTQALSINFNFGSGVKNGTYEEETDQIAIPDLDFSLGPYTTWFNRN
ncbi:MAG: hypothetical protein AB8B56_12990 [Crocinitomicaceae bacterium]